MLVTGRKWALQQVARFVCGVCGYVLGAWPPAGRPAACPGCMTVLDVSTWPEYGCAALDDAEVVS